MVGRTFTPEEATGNVPSVVMISHHLWQQRYGLDPAVVGRTMTLNGAPSTIVGVLPASFDFGSLFAPGRQVDVFGLFPLNDGTNRIGNSLGVVGRLKPGVTVDAAQAELAVLGRALTAAHPERNTLRPIVKPLSVHVAGHLRTALLLLAGAVGVVMLIVCANLANLQLARAASRRQEMAVRVALGAGRGRLLAQAITESLLLCGAGAALGLAVAVVATRGLTSLTAFNLPLLHTVRVDLATLGVLAALAVAAGVAIGVAPVLQMPTVSPQDRLRDGARGASEGRRARWARATLVVAEIAFACVLLVAAGLLMRSLASALTVDVGFDPSRAAALRFDPTWPDADPARRAAYFDEALRLARGTPGVEVAGVTDLLPLDGTRSWAIAGRGQSFPRGQFPEGFARMASDGYRQAMGLRLIAGRDLTPDDGPTGEPVVVVNQTLARTIWPGQDPIGQFLIADGLGTRERRVVGVVADVRHKALEAAAGPEMYIPIRQTRNYRAFYLVVRSSVPPAALESALRASLASLADATGGSRLRVLEELVDRAVSPRRFLDARPRRLRAVRAAAGLARRLRGGGLRRQPPQAGVRDPAGTGRFARRRPACSARGHAAPGGRRPGSRPAGGVAGVQPDAGSAVWGDAGGSDNVRRDDRRPRRDGAGGRLLASTPGVAAGSDAYATRLQLSSSARRRCVRTFLRWPMEGEPGRLVRRRALSDANRWPAEPGAMVGVPRSAA